MKTKIAQNAWLKRVLPRLGGAALFGAASYRALEFFQPFLLTPLYGYADCCERCKNILFDNAQPFIAASAGIAFLSMSLLRIKGWKGNLRAVFVCALSFQLYSIAMTWSVVRGEECTALYVSRRAGIFFPVVLAITLFHDTVIWTALCAIPVLLIRAIYARVFAPDEDVQRLDLRQREEGEKERKGEGE